MVLADTAGRYGAERTDRSTLASKNAHIGVLAWCVQADAGKIVMGGAVGETPEGAVFIWKDASKEVSAKVTLAP